MHVSPPAPGRSVGPFRVLPGGPSPFPFRAHTTCRCRLPACLPYHTVRYRALPFLTLLFDPAGGERAAVAVGVHDGRAAPPLPCLAAPPPAARSLHLGTTTNPGAGGGVCVGWTSGQAEGPGVHGQLCSRRPRKGCSLRSRSQAGRQAGRYAYRMCVRALCSVAIFSGR